MSGGGGFRPQTSPVTYGLTGVILLGALLTWGNPVWMTETFAMLGRPFPKVWTILTYPLADTVLLHAGTGPIFTVFLVMWLLGMGRNLEPEHGSAKFLGLWFALTLIGAIPLAIAGYSAGGTLIPVAMLSVIWGIRFKDATVMLFGLVPIAGKWLAVMSVLVVFFNYAVSGSQVLAGLLACLGCGVAYLYADNKIPKVRYGLKFAQVQTQHKPTKAQVEREKQYYDDVHRREKEREERERLRKLFEDSLGDDKN